MRTIILSFTMIVLSIYQSAQAQQVDTLSIRLQTYCRHCRYDGTGRFGELENISRPWLGRWDDGK